MFIKRVELENIKSHAEITFEFERGSTSICGENGAGKTTIIEAIAWTLFDLLAYKKDEFLRRGTKKGAARITFESGLDERDYTVYRDTNTGYYVYDPALKLRIADKKEEVTRFLWQHLGVEPGTDLETLFKHAIGVPQGTFTAIFLATAAERKKTFDTLLKVEEYRRGADELLKTSRFVEGQINAVSVKIARAEGEIARIDAISTEWTTLAAQVKTLAFDLGELTKMLGQKRKSVKELDEIEERLKLISAAAESLRSEKTRAEFVRSQREIELEQSRKAAAVIAEVKADAERHKQSLGRIKELEREREKRQEFRDALTKVETAEAKVTGERSRLIDEIEKIQTSRAEIETLRPAVDDQEKFESEVSRLRIELAKSEAAGRQIRSLDEKLARLRESYRANQTQLKEARERSSLAAELEKYQNRDAEIIHQLAHLNASLERDEAFQREIKNGLCPILSEKCLNLKNGETLETFVTSQFGELRTAIAQLRTEHATVTVALGGSREAEKFLVQLPVLESREREIAEEGTRLKAERAALETDLAALDSARSQLAEAEASLAKLDNPKARIALLESQVRREPQLREAMSAIEKNLERLESDRRITVEQLESYKDLDAHWSETTTTREATAAPYRTFIANEAAAGLLPERELQFATSDRELIDVTERLSNSETELSQAGKDYDRDQHILERHALSDLEKRLIELKTTFGVAAKREGELAAELERLEEVKRSMQAELLEKERLGKVLETTDFIRTTLKEAAPLVARNYVWHVSQEANQMFREIGGNAERTLKWTEDYGISLEENGYDRPFLSLSGGEQMAAALSVRLALLKQLSDIRIAFFDEPTINMDAERRENLAQQIGQIRHFDQLFVISHDDTFEGVMDHEIRVEK